MSRLCWNCKAVTYRERYCEECESDFATIAKVGTPIRPNGGNDNGSKESGETNALISLADVTVVCMADIVAFRRNGPCTICGTLSTSAAGKDGKGLRGQSCIRRGNDIQPMDKEQREPA